MTIWDDLVYNWVRVHRPYGSLEELFTLEGISLARMDITPPVWIGDESHLVLLHEDVIVLVGDGVKTSLLCEDNV